MANITKSDLLARLCALCTEVGERLYNSREPHDCFCNARTEDSDSFQFSSDIIDWIEEVVELSIPPKENKKNSDEWIV